jgi:hypothetical protein
MDQGLKFNHIAAIDLERHAVKKRPAGERFPAAPSSFHQTMYRTVTKTPD